MISTVPSDVSGRPQKAPKLGLATRLSHKLASSKSRGLEFVNDSQQVSPRPHNSMVQFTHVTGPNPPMWHSSSAQVLDATDQAPSRNKGLAPRIRQAVSSLKLSRPGNSEEIDSPQPVQLNNLSNVYHRPHPPHLRPTSPTELRTEDPIVERFEKLKLPGHRKIQSRGATPNPTLQSPQNTTTFSPQPLMQNLAVNAANSAWNQTTVSSPALPVLTKEPALPRPSDFISQSRPLLRVNSEVDLTEMEETDDESSVIASETVENPFQRSRRGRKRSASPVGIQSLMRRIRARRRDPSVSSSGSEYETPGSSRDGSDIDTMMGGVGIQEQSPHSERLLQFSDSSDSPPPLERAPQFLDSRDAELLQENLDRKLAEPLQQEEGNRLETIQSLYRRLKAASQQPSASRSTRNARDREQNNGESSGSTAYGSRENPINLESDSDTSERVVFRGRYIFIEGHIVDLDEDERDDNHADSGSGHKFIDPRTSNDYHLARQLQEEEDTSSRLAPATRDCEVCGENQPISELPSLAECEHPPNICATCYSEWITAQLQGSSWREAKCPESKCKTMLSYYEIQQMATPAIFEQYDTFMARAAINEDPNFRWCRACDFGQVHVSGEEGNIFTCASCGHKVCIVHENTWHEGETCQEYEYRASGRKERDQRAQEAASLDAIGKMSKKCPGKGCIYNIGKNDGCDHMTCSKCRHEFCWICLCDYNLVRSQGNSAHAKNCKYHSKRLR